MEENYRCLIQADLLENAKSELHEILLAQNLALFSRWHLQPTAIKAKKILRVVGLAASLTGFILSVILLVFAPQQTMLGLNVIVFVPILLVTTLLFLFFTKVDTRMQELSKALIHKQSKRRANVSFRRTQTMLPYRVEYDFRGDLLTCFRCKDDVWQYSWHRKLKGVAIQTNYVTAIFRKSNSLQPRIILLHDNCRAIEKQLQAAQLTIRQLQT